MVSPPSNKKTAHNNYTNCVVKDGYIFRGATLVWKSAEENGLHLRINGIKVKSPVLGFYFYCVNRRVQFSGARVDHIA
jgi:hypothetical protein